MLNFFDVANLSFFLLLVAMFQIHVANLFCWQGTTKGICDPASLAPFVAFLFWKVMVGGHESAEIMLRVSGSAVREGVAREASVRSRGKIAMR